MARIDTSEYLEMTQRIIAIFDTNIEIIPAIKEEFSIVPCFLPEELVHEANQNSVVISQLEEYIEYKFRYKFPIEVQLNGSSGFMIRQAIGKDGGFREHTLPMIMSKIKNRVIEDKAVGTVKVPFRLSKDELELLDNKVNQKSLLNSILKFVGIPREDIQSYEFSSIGLQMKRHTPFDSAKQRLYVLYSGKLGAKLTTLFTSDNINMAILNLEAKEFITKTLKAYNMDIEILKKLLDIEDKQDMVSRVFTTLQYGLERLLCSENILGAILYIPSGRLLKELDKLERENPLFPIEYMKKEKNNILELSSFQLYIMTLAEALLRDIISTTYFMNTDRYGYKKKIETLIKYILADAKHPEIKEARSLVIDFMNRLKEHNPAFSIIQSQEMISKYHGLNKNFEVVDVSSIIKTLEQIKREIDGLNTLINPTYKLISLQRRVLVYIDQVGVEVVSKEAKTVSKLRYIIGALKQPRARFKLKDLKFVLNISHSFLKDHIIKHIIEYQTTLHKVLVEHSMEYDGIKERLGEQPWRELAQTLRDKGKLGFHKIIKLDKHIDNTKEQKSENPEDNLQDGYVQVLIKAISSLIHYIEQEKEKIDTTKRIVLEFKDEVLKAKKETEEYNQRLQKFEEAKSRYDSEVSNCLFLYGEVDGDILASVNDKSPLMHKVDEIRQTILRGANGLYDIQIEVIQNLEVLNGKRIKNGVTIGLLKELLNVWDNKDKQLQIKYRELKNSQGEHNQQIEDEIASLISEISEYLVEQQVFTEPINIDTIFIPHMPKNNIQIIETQIIDMMGKKNNAQDVIKKFISDYTFNSPNPDKAKLVDGVFELLRRKNIHEQDKDKFVVLINKHFDLLKERETVKEQLMIDFEMPQRLISVAEESSILKPVDMSKDMKHNVLEAIQSETLQSETQQINEGKTPKSLLLDKYLNSIIKVSEKTNDVKLIIEGKYIKHGDNDDVMIKMSIHHKSSSQNFENYVTINGEKYEETLPKLLQKIIVTNAKDFLSKIENVSIKKYVSEKLKMYIDVLK